MKEETNNVFTKIGGRKAAFGIFGIIVPFYYVIWKSFALHDFSYLIPATPMFIGALLALAGINVYQKKILNGK